MHCRNYADNTNSPIFSRHCACATSFLSRGNNTRKTTQVLLVQCEVMWFHSMLYFTMVLTTAFWIL